MADDGFTTVTRKKKSRNKKKNAVTEDSDAKASEVTSGERNQSQSRPSQSQPQSSKATQNHVSAQDGGRAADTSVSVPESRSPAKVEPLIKSPVSVADDDGWSTVSRKKGKNRRNRQTNEAAEADAVAAPMVNGVDKGSQQAQEPKASNNAPASKKKKKKKKAAKKGGDLVKMITELIQSRDPLRSSLSLGDLGNFFQEDYGTSWNKSYKSTHGQMRTFILAHDEFVVKDDVVWLKAKAPKPNQAAPAKPPAEAASSPPRRKVAKQKKKQASKKSGGGDQAAGKTRQSSARKPRAQKPGQQELAGNGINWGFALMLLLSIGVICIAVAIDQTSSSQDSELLERIKQVLAGLGLPL